MLYDILSPLIFFFSLGGILLIIGRVVIRLRREQFTTSIKSAGHGNPALQMAVGEGSSSEAAEILKPNQKSVHAMRTRVALIGHMFSSSKTTISQGWQGWKTRRAEKAAAKQVAVMEREPVAEQTEAVKTPAPSEMSFLENEGEGITAPTKQSLFKRLTPWRKAEVASVAPVEESAVPAEEVPPVITESVVLEPVEKEPEATFRLVKKEEVVTPAAEAPVPVAPVPEPGAALGERGFAKALLRRARAKKSPATALQQAETALGVHDFPQAEAVLVPYIVQHPKDTWAYVLLGRAALGREAWVEAMEIFEQVVKWNNKQEGAYTGLGLAAYRAGKFTRALQALQRAHDADPEDITVLESLLSIAEKMDNKALQHSIHEKLDVLRAREQAEDSSVPTEKISA